MDKIYIKNISSLEKVLPRSVCESREINSASALVGEEFSYQIAFKARDDAWFASPVSLEINSDLSELIKVYNVKCVPVLFSHFYHEVDNAYICDEPSLIPDILEPYEGSVKVSPRVFFSVWVSVKVDKSVCAGNHNINIVFKSGEDIWGESSFDLFVIDKELPTLDIPCTDWFHCDCIASYHGCEPLSEEHWTLIDSYMSVAREHGINMLLTPVFTPPLDTEIGGERPTVQLVDVIHEDGKYTFKFDKLKRWLDLCRKNHIEYIEISHLYTQWGAEHAPKIIVTENGKQIQKFGWQTDSMGEEYRDFISSFIPKLNEFLEENWDKGKVYFHISDEPSEKHIEFYGRIFGFIKPILGSFKQMDAISDYELYKKGFIDTPVVATSEINNFINNGVDNIWAYYCCGQDSDNLSNRFIAMPSFRNRIIGLQLYKYDIKGFLHWGYNFYYSRLSTRLINPYVSNDADGGFPAGDSFSVYPVIGGAVPSLRLKVFNQALQDMMAAKLLECYIGKDAVIEIIEREGEITFNKYPMRAENVLSIREAINSKINEVLK